MAADGLLPIDGLRIEHLVGIDKGQLRATLAAINLAVKARAAAGVAGGADLLDPDPDRVLVAVQAHLDHALGVAGGLALAPQRIARAAEVPGVAAFDGLAQRLGIHVRDHQHLAARSIGGDAGHKAGRVEFGLEFQPLLALIAFRRFGHSQSSQRSTRGYRCGPRTMDRKRACSAGLSRNMPVKRLVNVVAPCLATPRTDMQGCSASIITATPRGLRISSIVAAICAVRCSWVCRRRAKISVRRASFDNPTTRSTGV